MKFKPTQDRLLIRRDEGEQKSPGGLFIPDTVKEKPNEGVVIEVGPGRVLENGTRQPMAVRIGNRVLFGKYSAEVQIETDKFVIIREDEVLGVLE